MAFDVRRFDIYRKVPKDLTQPTYTGAVVSICCVLFILFLLLSEFSVYFAPEIHSELFVDDPNRHHDRIPVRLNISVPHLKCEQEVGIVARYFRVPNVSRKLTETDAWCSLIVAWVPTWEVVLFWLGLTLFVAATTIWAAVLVLAITLSGAYRKDDAGRHEVGHNTETQKIPLDDGVGCRFETGFSINKVPGNFHVSTHAAGHAAHTASDIPNFQHTVHELSFGHSLKYSGKHIPGSYNSITSVMHATDDPSANHEYVIKIVPTVYEDLRGNTIAAYQYTYAHKSYPTYGQMIPAVWFRYDLTPITVKYTERTPPLYHFLTTICAIVGGTFTVAGIIDSLIFTTGEMLRKKIK